MNNKQYSLRKNSQGVRVNYKGDEYSPEDFIERVREDSSIPKLSAIITSSMSNGGVAAYQECQRVRERIDSAFAERENDSWQNERTAFFSCRRS